MAVGCILASLPVAFLKYPWLPATIMEYAELRREPAPGATQSYYEGRQHNLERTELALVWYFIGTVALGGLVVVAAGIVPWWVELAIWILTFAAGAGIAQFVRLNIGRTTLPAYTIATVYLPWGVAVAAALAAILVVLSKVLGKSAVAAGR